MKIVTFCSIKGGVGKTSGLTVIARAVAKQLQEQNRGKVLVLDFDSNGSSTQTLMSFKKELEVDRIGKHIASALLNKSGLEKFIVKSSYDNLYIVAGHDEITHISITQLMLRNLLNSSNLTEFEYIFIDLPATYYDLHTMALTVSDVVVTPVIWDFYNCRSSIQLKRHLLEDFGPEMLKKWIIYTNRKGRKVNPNDQKYIDNFVELKDPYGNYMFKEYFSEHSMYETCLTKRVADEKYFISKNKAYERFNAAICDLASDITGETINPQEKY